MSKFDEFCFWVFALSVLFSVYAVPMAILKIIMVFTHTKEINEFLFFLMVIVVGVFIIKGSRVHEEKVRDRTIFEIQQK